MSGLRQADGCRARYHRRAAVALRLYRLRWRPAVQPDGPQMGRQSAAPPDEVVIGRWRGMRRLRRSSGRPGGGFCIRNSGSFRLVRNDAGAVSLVLQARENAWPAWLRLQAPPKAPKAGLRSGRNTGCGGNTGASPYPSVSLKTGRGATSVAFGRRGTSRADRGRRPCRDPACPCRRSALPARRCRARTRRRADPPP